MSGAIGQNTKTQQGKGGATEHMAFEEFEAVDVSLKEPIALGKLQSRLNRRVITARSACKGAHFSDFGLQRCLQPAIEFIDEAFPYNPGKMLSGVHGLFQVGMSVWEQYFQLELSFIQLFGAR